jgi:hypothetical protein
MSPPIIDLTGMRFGMLVVLSRQVVPHSRTAKWLCRCDCGREKVAQSFRLRRGHTRSCGCLAKEISSAQLRTHGKSKTREFRIWTCIKNRVFNRNDPKFTRYGGRGISMCDRWASSFEAFYADMGPCPSSSHSVDRIDNNGHYSPENCRWATPSEQARNRGNNRMISAFGQERCVTEWAEIMGIDRLLVFVRLSKGWTPERALTAPVRRWPSQKSG